ncbi:MAG: CPBP family intramembrane metalloprotease [Eubacteriales bacterium]|nr:CPBP family intramembrane metalloprotease [Eubacteriales bacterium]
MGIVVYGILAPLGEETVFRGVVYGQLKKISNVPVAIVLSGLAFGLFHGNLVQAVYATALGIVLALVYEIYDSILAAMLFHGVANLFVYVLLDLTDFGGIFVMPFSCAFFLMISAIALALMVKWQKNE